MERQHTSGHIPLCSQTPMEQSQVVQYEHNLAACYEAEYLLSIKIQEDMYSVSGLCRSPEHSYDDSSEVYLGYNQPPLGSRVNPQQPGATGSVLKPGECSSFLRGAYDHQHHNGMMTSLNPQSSSLPLSQSSPCTAMDCTMSYETPANSVATATMPVFQAQGTPHYHSGSMQSNGVTQSEHYHTDITVGYTFPFSQRYSDDGYKREEEEVHSEGPVRKKHRPEY